jgi:hypothetical protein
MIEAKTTSCSEYQMTTRILIIDHHEVSRAGLRSLLAIARDMGNLRGRRGW